jgi:hypothetical protein
MKRILQRSLMAIAIPAGAGAADFGDVALFVSRSYVCNHQPSSDDRTAADCQNLDRDKSVLLRRYHDQPDILAMINHPEKVRHVGFSGVDRYPQQKTTSYQ